jgi:hypothetical protein
MIEASENSLHRQNRSFHTACHEKVDITPFPHDEVLSLNESTRRRGKYSFTVHESFKQKQSLIQHIFHEKSEDSMKPISRETSMLDNAESSLRHR